MLKLSQRETRKMWGMAGKKWRYNFGIIPLYKQLSLDSKPFEMAGESLKTKQHWDELLAVWWVRSRARDETQRRLRMEKCTGCLLSGETVKAITPWVMIGDTGGFQKRINNNTWARHENYQSICTFKNWRKNNNSNNLELLHHNLLNTQKTDQEKQ